MTNPTYWKTSTPTEDVEKFTAIRMKSINEVFDKKISNKAIRMQINQIEKVHKRFPMIRFYGFHNQAKLFIDEHFYPTAEVELHGYERCPRLPDGYYFNYDYGCFLVEIENYSRLDKPRINDYIEWWMNAFDWWEYFPLFILEFNRFGEFQRDALVESDVFKSGIDALNKIKGLTK
jgi:hypothetical protein